MQLPCSAAAVLLRQACHDHKQLLDALVDANVLPAFHNEHVLPVQCGGMT
jgi:hypothetical protein